MDGWMDNIYTGQKIYLSPWFLFISFVLCHCITCHLIQSYIFSMKKGIYASWKLACFDKFWLLTDRESAQDNSICQKTRAPCLRSNDWMLAWDLSPNKRPLWMKIYGPALAQAATDEPISEQCQIPITPTGPWSMHAAYTMVYINKQWWARHDESGKEKVEPSSWYRGLLYGWSPRPLCFSLGSKEAELVKLITSLQQIIAASGNFFEVFYIRRRQAFGKWKEEGT